MSVTTAPATTAAGAQPQLGMVEAARRLQAELDRRWSSSLPGRAPLVAVLGADVFGAAPDPDRSSATVHVGSSTIYVGPWAAVRAAATASPSGGSGYAVAPSATRWRPGEA